MIEKGRQILRCFSFSPNHRIRAGFGTCIEIETSTGCRGVAGPVPQPLCMRPLVSTDADRLIYEWQVVKALFYVPPKIGVLNLPHPGRGRTLRRLSRKPATGSIGRAPANREPTSWCSLSLGERGRVRASVHTIFTPLSATHNSAPPGCKSPPCRCAGRGGRA